MSLLLIIDAMMNHLCYLTVSPTPPPMEYHISPLAHLTGFSVAQMVILASTFFHLNFCRCMDEKKIHNFIYYDFGFH